MYHLQNDAYSCSARDGTKSGPVARLENFFLIQLKQGKTDDGAIVLSRSGTDLDGRNNSIWSREDLNGASTRKLSLRQVRVDKQNQITNLQIPSRSEPISPLDDAADVEMSPWTPEILNNHVVCVDLSFSAHCQRQCSACKDRVKGFKTFIRAALDDWTNLSQTPPKLGARGGKEIHWILLAESASERYEDHKIHTFFSFYIVRSFRGTYKNSPTQSSYFQSPSHFKVQFRFSFNIFKF